MECYAVLLIYIGGPRYLQDSDDEGKEETSSNPSQRGQNAGSDKDAEAPQHVSVGQTVPEVQKIHSQPATNHNSAPHLDANR